MSAADFLHYFPVKIRSKRFEHCVGVCVIRGLQKEELVLLTHGDSVDKVADGFKVVAQSGNIIAGERSAKAFYFIHT